MFDWAEKRVLLSVLQKKRHKSSSLWVDPDEFYWGCLRQPNHEPFFGFVLEGQWKPPLQCVPEMNRPFSGKADGPKAGSAPSDLLVDLDTVRDLSSGHSKYRDFIRHLPIHLSKYILSMLGVWGDFLRDHSLQSHLKVPRSIFYVFRYAG